MSLFNRWTDIPFITSCEDEFLLPDLPIDPECGLAERLAEISDLFITPCGTPNPFDWTTDPIGLVPDVIDNTNTTNSKTRHLVGIGTRGDHEPTQRTGPRFSRTIILRTYTIEFLQSLADPKVRQFLRYLQSNWRKYVFQYGTVGGDLFGGPAGIRPDFVDVQMPHGSGKEAFQEARIILEFDSEHGDPQRGTNPLFAISGCISGGGEVIEGV